MELNQNLKELLRGRIRKIEEAKSSGKKVVGYYPAEYMPEEMVMACGAVPLGLAQGGDNAAVENAGPYLPRWLCTFNRAQVGYIMMKYDPFYEIFDMYMMTIIDGANAYAVAAIEGFTDLNTFKFEVPHHKKERALNYFLDSLYRYKDKLEELTGNKITDDGLKEAIELCNKERKLQREITELRKNDSLPISGMDYAKIIHASYVADKAEYVKFLESALDELKGAEGVKPEGPRILLTGSTLGAGDYKIHRIIENLGGDVVVEQFCEGLRDFWHDVDLNGDPMKALAERYFMKKIAHGVFTPAVERLEFVADLAKEYKADAVIWYTPMYRDAFDMEAIYFPEILKERAGLSMLKLMTDYDPTETGAFRTRVEAFFEMID
ncbi:MAG: 2-hydroxyacyl-CoA dehydratase family protein [Desulfatiglans sp.]|jgi:benzoyl-CoA reductase/2-hydroxyglutaryl-CoA dehydratase subunit BcrC/BadD/HgdB|nr:2-hydroxyacyl-CoA dehydratase family protein [Thermodesulfobacteriota bacterium]MEE4351854.1 2-hydroxyacyl-CoA dehydratase family protein [Desulfatiglans sp.]